MTASLLTSKQQLNHPAAQVKTLMRIAKRAVGQAERSREISHDLDAARRLHARAGQAIDEALAIVRANPDAGWTMPQLRAARQAAR